ncbi:MAG: glycosyltransferase [Flavobacteriales bacterium]|jgi:glycosyltransferase involved in cell wall biosynthesis
MDEQEGESDMKILQLCLKPPLPARDGGCIAMNNITQGLLAEGHKVKVLTIFTHKHDFLKNEMPREYVAATRIEGVFVDTRLNVMDAFANFMTADSYNISRFFSPDMDRKVMEVLTAEKFDIIHLESLFMTPYLPMIRRHSSAPIVLRSHNLEFVIWEKITHGTRNIAKRTYLKYLTTKLREYELKALDSVNGIAAISGDDMRRFKKLGVKKPIRTIPFGIDPSKYECGQKKPEFALFHLGAMDWSPNLEGIIWFLEAVWPKVHAQYPKLKFYIAGRNMPEDLARDLPENVVAVGEVERADEYMKSKAVMIVPLLSGGGIRVKIIEGLALGKAIISTSIGAEGTDCENDRQLLIADTPSEWVKAVGRLIEENELYESLGKAGIAHVAAHFDNQKIIRDLIAFYKELRAK